MRTLEAGDVVVIPAVDRLSRDTTDLPVIARDMQRAGAGLLAVATDAGARRVETHQPRRRRARGRIARPGRNMARPPGSGTESTWMLSMSEFQRPCT
jgi:hypothetical protein